MARTNSKRGDKYAPRIMMVTRADAVDAPGRKSRWIEAAPQEATRSISASLKPNLLIMERCSRDPR
jgi:hypothetical protein